MKRIVIDSSALLALIYEEKGYDIVEPYLQHAVISTVNLTEVVSYLTEKGMDIKEARLLLEDLAIEIVPYDDEQAFLAGELRKKTKLKGLSLGDRACLALAMVEELQVLTADKAWADVKVGVKVKLIR
jgi:ribonuclease VapC